jgi:hypothetical protein
MTLARTHPHLDAATAYLELTGTLLRACRAYFTDSTATMAAARAVVDELEDRAARPGHPAAGLARRWRTGALFGLARELRDGLAGVRLMVESAAVAAGNAAGELGCCEESHETGHGVAMAMARRTMVAHVGFVELAGRLTELDTIFKGLRAEPWSVPDRRVVELLRRRVASGDLTRAVRELVTSEALLDRVLVEVSVALET